MQADLPTIGGLVAALLVLAEVIKLLINRVLLAKLNGRNANARDKMAQEVHDLLSMHQKFDADGVPVWYIRRSFERAVGDLGKSVTELNQHIATLNKSAEVTAKQISTIKREVHEICMISRGELTGGRIRLDDIEE